MGMPITIELVDAGRHEAMEAAFAELTAADERFSTYKEGSEISRINRGEVPEGAWSPEMREVLALAEATRRETHGYFDIHTPSGALDPSGIVKGWAIKRAAAALRRAGVRDFYVNAGGDIASAGANSGGTPWSVGIENPLNRSEVVKVIYPRGKGVATSGTAARGQHIWDPHRPGEPITGIASITVVGPDVLEADRFATAAFAMGTEGIAFIEGLPGFEGYAISTEGRATLTSGFAAYTAP